MADSFTARVIALIGRVPEGKVSTYGRIARMAGNPRGARQVVRILHTCSEKYDLPWHRIINRFGEIPYRASMYDDFQKDILMAEGVEVDDRNRIDLSRYLWLNDNTDRDI